MPTNLPAVIAAVEQRLPELKQLLPADVSPASFLAHFKTAAMQTPGLLDCTPRSVVLACVRAANDGLVLDAREAVIIVRNQKTPDGWAKVAVYQRMYSGTLKRVRAALPGCKVEARLVFEGDAFTLRLGDDPMIEHTPSFGAERGDFLGCYAIVTEAGGVRHRDWMEVDEINAIRDRSQGYDPTKPKGPWHTDFGEMAKKTVLNRLSKLLPQAQGRPAIAADADDHGGATDEVEVWDATTVALPQPEEAAAPTAPTALRPDAVDAAVKQGTVAEVQGGEITSGKAPFKREANGDLDVQTWKLRLRELRDGIEPVLARVSVSDAWDEWHEKYQPVPDEVVTAAKGLIDKRLAVIEAAAKAYEEAKG